MVFFDDYEKNLGVLHLFLMMIRVNYDDGDDVF